MECSAASVSGCRCAVAGVGRRGAGTGQGSEAAQGRERMVEALKELHGRICRTSHQKCLVWGSRSGKEMVRTRDGAGLGDVR